MMTILLREVDRRELRLVLAMFVGPRLEQLSNTIGVAPRGSLITSPLGVKQNRWSENISSLTASRNSW